MSAQFEFHLKGVSAPEGELDADHLLAIVTSLKEVATKLGRAETDAEPVGRAPKRVHRVAKLLIGLAPGSTTVRAHRAGAGDGTLDFDLEDERAFDEKFAALVDSIARDQRPDWVSDSLSLAAAELTSALQQAAPEVEFKVNGQARPPFKTAEVHRETWRVTDMPAGETVTFVGRLYAVNLNTHRLQVHAASRRHRRQRRPAQPRPAARGASDQRPHRGGTSRRRSAERAYGLFSLPNRIGSPTASPTFSRTFTDWLPNDLAIRDSLVTNRATARNRCTDGDNRASTLGWNRGHRSGRKHRGSGVQQQ